MQFVPRRLEDRTYLYSLMCSAPVQELILQRVSGSTGSRQRAQPSAVAILPVLMPAESVRKAFHELVGPMLSRMSENLKEIARLAKSRDFLLPQLLSGAVHVRQVQSMV